MATDALIEGRASAARSAGRPIIRRAGLVVSTAGVLGVIGQLLSFEVGLGINFPIAVALLVAGGWLLRSRAASPDGGDEPGPVDRSPGHRRGARSRIRAQRHRSGVRFITEQNAARLLDPQLVPQNGSIGLDVSYVAGLGDEAIPALVRALPALEGHEAEFLRAQQEFRRQELTEEPGLAAWQAWTAARAAARDALEATR